MDTDTGERRQLVRRRADAKIWGVAAGLADYFSIDPIWVRLGFVLSIFAGGLGLIAYITLRLLMPASDEPAAEPKYGPREIGSWFSGSTVGTVIIVLGLIVVATQVFERSAGWFWGLALIGLGIWLFRDRDDDQRGTPVEPPSHSVAIDSDAATPPAPARAVRRRTRERSHLGALTIGATFVLLGAMWLLDVAGVVGVRLVHYFAASLLVLGLGIAIGAWIGRARWLILPALILLPMTVASSAIALPFEGDIGEAYVRAQGYGAIAPEYTHAIGSFTLDLHALEPRSGSPVPVEVKVPIGTINVFVPADLAIEVRGRVGIGDVTFQGIDTAGFDLDQTRRFGPPGEAVAMVLDLRVSLGSVNVWQVEQPRVRDR